MEVIVLTEAGLKTMVPITSSEFLQFRKCVPNKKILECELSASCGAYTSRLITVSIGARPTEPHPLAGAGTGSKGLRAFCCH